MYLYLLEISFIYLLKITSNYDNIFHGVMHSIKNSIALSNGEKFTSAFI